MLTGALPDGPRTVAREDLRHQLEFEAMGKLLRLRRGILASSGEAKEELALLEAARSAVLVLFRSLLRVEGEAATGTSEEVVRRASALAGFDATVFLDLEAHARGTARIPPRRPTRRSPPSTQGSRSSSPTWTDSWPADVRGRATVTLRTRHHVLSNRSFTRRCR